MAARRIRSGSGHRYELDGQPVDGVTAILRGGVPKENLIGWAARSVAGYAIDHWQELEELSVSKRLRELERAAWAERDAAAVRGTKVHQLAQELIEGREVDVPEELTGHVDACLAFVNDYDVDEIAVEAAVLHRGATLATSYMGSLDLLARLDGQPDLWLIDWKTGGSGVWPEMALQLCAYAHAHVIVDKDGTEHPMPHVDRAAVVWLRADGYDVVPVDISASTFRTFQYAQQVAHFTARERSAYVADALAPRTFEAAAS